MKEQKTDLEEAKGHMEAYVSNHLELAKLELAEHSANVAASLVVSVSTAVLALVTLCFLSVAVAFYIGHLLGAFHWGFLVVGGFYLFIFILYAALGKPVLQKTYANGIIKKMFNSNDK